LVNPLLSSWDHGSVESSGTEFNENTISVAYEAVHYTSGNVARNTPAGFADQSVGYDVTPSPLGYLDNAMIPGGGEKGLLPALIGLGTSALLNKAFGNRNSPSKNILAQVATGVIGGVVANVLSQNKLPVPDPQNKQTAVTSGSNNSAIRSSSQVTQTLAIPAVSAQVLPSLINSGALSNVNINEYNSATTSQKAAYNAEISAKVAGGDQKLTQLASNALDNLGY
jgi:hypothetical protein